MPLNRKRQWGARETMWPWTGSPAMRTRVLEFRSRKGPWATNSITSRGPAVKPPHGIPWAPLTTRQVSPALSVSVVTQSRQSDHRAIATRGGHNMMSALVRCAIIWPLPQSTQRFPQGGPSTCAWTQVCLWSPTPHNNLESLSIKIPSVCLLALCSPCQGHSKQLTKPRLKVEPVSNPPATNLFPG